MNDFTFRLVLEAAVERKKYTFLFSKSLWQVAQKLPSAFRQHRLEGRMCVRFQRGIQAPHGCGHTAARVCFGVEGCFPHRTGFSGKPDKYFGLPKCFAIKEKKMMASQE